MSKGEETKQMIIERAAPIFNKKGIAATAMSDIMDATKLAKGSLYVHFENKDVLAEAVVNYNLQLLSDKWKREMDRFTHPKDKLFAFVDVYKNPLNPPVAGGCPMMNFGTEADDQFEVIREQVSTKINSVQQSIRKIIEDGIQQGAFRSDWNYKEFATIMFAMMEGGIFISKTTRSMEKMNIVRRTLKQMIEAQSL